MTNTTDSNKNRVVVILGPTAVGKTELSLKLAQKLNTEIISGDSMLIYKELDIGTAKPTAEERIRVKHHLIDILPPRATYNVTEFFTHATSLIKELNEKHKLPLLVGGTGLYLKSLLEGYNFNQAPENPQLRQKLETLAKEKGRKYVLDMLATVDPDTADKLHINNFRRIIRAIEVYEYNKDTISRDKYAKRGELAYNAVVIGLTRERSNLYERINQRVDLMIADGWLDEVKTLLANGVKPTDQSMQAIGYRQLAAYLNNEIPLPQAIEEIKKATRHFAKRQLTWYRKMPYIDWLQADAYSSDELLDMACALITKKFE